MNLELKGKLVQVLQEQTGSGKNGTWVKQGFILEAADGQYLRKVYFTMWGEKTQQLKAIKPGTEIKVSFGLESREFNGKYYTDARAWKIETVSGAGDTQGVSAASDVPDFITPGSTEVQDDLPF